MSLIITEFSDLIPKSDIHDNIALVTREKREIKNKQIKNILRTPLFNKTIVDLKSQYGCIERPDTISGIYNCHGLTFASKRTGIDEDIELDKIFADDSYKVIVNFTPFFKEDYTLGHLLPGDIVLYIKANGSYSHSGIVLSIPTNITRPTMFEIQVLSKWGDGFEAIHGLYECPYFESQIKFLRCIAI